MKKGNTSRQVFESTIASVTEMNWARLAAFIDGEGTIHIARGGTARSASVAHFLLLTVGNTDLRLHGWLASTFTGRVALQGEKRPKCKQMYSWRQSDQRAAIILRRCLPYLICKREQAETALAFRELFPGEKINGRLSAETLSAREDLCLRVRKLNARGVGELEEIKISIQ